MPGRQWIHAPGHTPGQVALWRQSNRTLLAALRPERVVTGHGPALRGPQMRSALDALARDFDRLAVPRQGHYVDHPSNVENHAAYEPPR